MPEAVHDLAERLKQHPEVRDPWALATAITKKKQRLQAARAEQKRKKEQEGSPEG